jgi:hypothetical protein
MSSFYDDASLVVIPSGYKTSKVYAEKPTDGSGDLTFTRTGDTATRVNSAGIIEKVRTNIILQSETFNNASWSKSDCSITSNTTANPINGALTADTFTLAAGTTQKYAAQLLTINGNFTASVYLKAGTHQFVQFLLGSDSSPIANFDLTNGTASGTNSTASIVSAGNGWYRCSMAFTSSTADGIFILAVDSLAATRFSTTASTGTFIAFGYQLERNDIATAYIPTTTAAVSVGPVANVPRLDYLGSTCPRLLLEPQRTNLALYSEQFDNAGWTGGGATAVANQAASPDGYTNADLIYPTTSGTFTGKYQNIAASTTGVVSCYVKQAGKRFAQLGTDNNATFTCAFDLQLGTIVRTATNYTATITNVGNGWFRITAAYVSSAAASYPFIGVSDNSAGAVVTDGTNGLYVYGFQYEASAAYPTSYIPTLAASATRGADAASKTGISSLIGVNGGSIFVELDANGLNSGVANYIFDLSDGTNFDQNRIAMYWTSANDLNIFYAYGGTTASVSYTFNFLTTKKVAVRWTSTQIQVVVNGVAQTAVTYGNSSPTKLDIGSRFNAVEHLSSNAKQCLLFNTTLTAAQLAELTTI